MGYGLSGLFSREVLLVVTRFPEELIAPIFYLEDGSDRFLRDYNSVLVQNIIIQIFIGVKPSNLI
jgi:hypothetical protein